MANKTQKQLKQLKETIGKNRREFYPYTIPEAVLNEDGTTLKDTLQALPSIYIQQSEKGKANGVATLGTDGKIPESQMPQEYVESKGNCLTKQEASKTYLTKAMADGIYAKQSDIPDMPDLSVYITEADAEATYAKKTDIPMDTEKNVIVAIKRNGNTVTPDSSRTVNITVPTKISELTNDSGFNADDFVLKSNIIITSTDPGEGGTVSYEDGTILFVYDT